MCVFTRRFHESGRAVEAGYFLKGVLGKAKSLKGKEETYCVPACIPADLHSPNSLKPPYKIGVPLLFFFLMRKWGFRDFASQVNEL